MKSLHNGTELTIRVRGVRYAIALTARGPRKSIRPYEVHTIDAHGVRMPVENLSAVLTTGEEFYVRCLASALREGVEFAANPPAPEGDDGGGEPEPTGDDDDDDSEPFERDDTAGAPIGSTITARRSSNPAECDHPGLMFFLASEREECPHCGMSAPMGSM